MTMVMKVYANSDYQVFSKEEVLLTLVCPQTTYRTNHIKQNYNFNKPSLIETKKEHNIVYFKQEYFACFYNRY